MTPVFHLRLLRELLLAEGPRSVRDRLLDRLAERARRRSFQLVPAGEPIGASAPVVVLLATEPAVRLGGVQAQLTRRLAAMDLLGEPYALLYPLDPRTFRLDLVAGDVRRSVRLAVPPRPTPPALADPVLERLLLEALDVAGASVLHVEHLGDLAPRAVLGVATAGRRVILSVHDFTLFCPRPHLLEQPERRFCHYSRDFDRCTACLRQDWPVADTFQAERRRLSAELLARADAVIFPSPFLREAFEALFPGSGPARARVLEPPLPTPPTPKPRVRRGDGLHVAFLGGARPHKGSGVLEQLLADLPSHGGPVRWTVFGGGEPAVLRRLRRTPGVAVRGYYRWGTLPALLHRERVDVALILSIVPESHGLTLTESWTAGVPVVAFDLGSVAERIRRHGGGLLVPPEQGASGVARALASLARDPAMLRRLTSEATAVQAQDGAVVAREIAELYRQASD